MEVLLASGTQKVPWLLLLHCGLPALAAAAAAAAIAAAAVGQISGRNCYLSAFPLSWPMPCLPTQSYATEEGICEEVNGILS